MSSPVASPAIVRAPHAVSDYLEKIIDKKVEKIALSLFEKIADFFCYYLYPAYYRRLEYRMKEVLGVLAASEASSDVQEESDENSEPLRDQVQAVAKKVVQPEGAEALEEEASPKRPKASPNVQPLNMLSPQLDPKSVAEKSAKLDDVQKQVKPKSTQITEKVAALFPLLKADDSQLSLKITNRLIDILSCTDDELNRQLDTFYCFLDLDVNCIDYVYYHIKFKQSGKGDSSALVKEVTAKRAYLDNLIGALRLLQSIYDHGEMGIKVGNLWNVFDDMYMNDKLFTLTQYTPDLPSRLKKIYSFLDEKKAEKEIDSVFADLKIPYLGLKGLKG